MTTLTPFVVTKRTLPKYLRNTVPSLVITADVERLIAPRYIGKVIQHRGWPAIIVDVHQHLRRLLVNGNRLWVPLRLADRKRLNLERMQKSRRHLLLRLPCWTGEARPSGVQQIRVRSSFPSVPYLGYLVQKRGYNGHAAYAAVVRGHLPWLHLADRRRTKEGRGQQGVGRHPEHPFIPATPTERLTKGGGFRKEQVTAAIEKHRWDDAHSTAVFEVVYLRRKPFLVAASLGLKLTTVYQFCSRVRTDLQEEQRATKQGRITRQTF